MKSPFPGMDPYLEQCWGDVHQSLITYAREMLNERLPADLRARVAVALAENVVAQEPLIEPETQGFIEILEPRPQRRVITVLEVLSPSNKYAEPGRETYQQKQRDLIRARISLVEIDLLRAGPHALQVPLALYPLAARTPYKVCVHRGWAKEAELYRVPLREPLPAIKVPLRETDADVVLDLQTLLERVYHHGRYDDIDYTVPPVPPLEPADAAWADALLRSAGLRPPPQPPERHPA